MNKNRLLSIAGLLALMILSGTGFAFCRSMAGTREKHRNKVDKPPELISDEGIDLQQAIDTAVPYSTIICNRNEQLVISTPVVIRKPLTLQGLNARLPDSLKTPLIIVESEGFQFYDFELTGNKQSVDRKNKKPLVIIHHGKFRIENGRIVNSSKDGFSIIPTDGGTIEGGIIRDVIGINNRVDVISIDGGDPGEKISQILVENIRGYNSDEKGTVEVSDGVENVTARKIYAENSLYAVDVQQHSHVDKINRNVLVEDIIAKDCKHALRTANSPVGHTNLTIRDVIAERCTEPVKVKNTENVVLEKVRIIDYKGDGDLISITNCDGLTIRDITVQKSVSSGSALMLENCNHTIVDGVMLKEGSGNVSHAIRFLLSIEKNFSGLLITNVFCPNNEKNGIQLERITDKAILSHYIVYSNLTSVSDQIGGKTVN